MSTDQISVTIDLGDRSYPIDIAEGLLSDPALFSQCPKASMAVIVTNDVVAPLYAATLEASLRRYYPRVHTVILPDGEEFKTWQTLQKIFDGLLENGADRKTVLFALGGGWLAT